MNTDSEGWTPILLRLALGHCPVNGIPPRKSAVLSSPDLCSSVSICGCIDWLRPRLRLTGGWILWPAGAAFNPAQTLVAGLPKQCFESAEGVERNVGAAGKAERLRGRVRLIGIVEAFDGVGVDAAPLAGLELLPDDGVPNAELGRLGVRFVGIDDASGGPRGWEWAEWRVTWAERGRLARCGLREIKCRQKIQGSSFAHPDSLPQGSPKDKRSGRRELILLRRPLSPRSASRAESPGGPFCSRPASGWRTSLDCFEFIDISIQYSPVRPSATNGRTEQSGRPSASPLPTHVVRPLWLQ